MVARDRQKPLYKSQFQAEIFCHYSTSLVSIKPTNRGGHCCTTIKLGGRGGQQALREPCWSVMCHATVVEWDARLKRLAVLASFLLCSKIRQQ